MAKHLRTITEDKRLEGVKKSKVEDGEVYGGKDASVHQNDPSTVEFTKMHKVEKHADRAGNETVPYTQPNIKQAILKPEEKRHGNTLAKATTAYKAANEDVSCNSTEAGKKCPVHEMDACPGTEEPKDKPKTGQKMLLDKKAKVSEEAEQIDEMPSQHRSPMGHGKGSWAKEKAHKIAYDKPRSFRTPGTASKADLRAQAEKLSKGVPVKKMEEEIEQIEEGGMPASVIKHKQDLANMSDKDFAEKHGHKTEKQLRDMAARHGFGFDKATKTGSDHYVKRVAASKNIDEEQLDEVITKKTKLSSVIKDFIKSKDPRFAGKSTAERQKMAAGAYYGMHPEKSKFAKEDANAVEPLLGEGGKNKKGKKMKESGPDGQIYPSGQVPNRTMDTKSDTGYNI